jgi:protein O-mannosyl-transferase
MNTSHLRWLVIIILGLAIYGQTFGFNFVFDDNYLILNTPYIRSFDTINQIWAILPKTRMIGVYSFALNYFIDQAHPQGYHIFNFLIHLLAVGLVWALADLLFRITKFSQGGLTKELPFIIAVLFLVHPCQTQAVTYISQRFESMATVFYLASIYCYLRGRISSSGNHSVFLFVCSAGFAILGIFTKEVAVTIPLMVLAAEFILFNRKPRLSIIVLGVIFACLFMKIVRTDFISIYFHFTAPSESHDGDIITGGKYVLTQMRVFLTFMRLLILPIDQNLDYDYPLSTGLLNPPLTLAGLSLIGFITFLIFKLRKQWPLISFGLAWILITFSINTAPRSNVIFEHKLYLISFGFFLAAVCALSIIIKNRKILFGILTTLIAVLSLLSFLRNQVWKNELTLWNDVVQKSPHKARPYEGLGIAYGMQGDLIRALLNFNRAIEINPNYSQAYGNRGNAYLKLGDYTQANADLNKAIALNPGYAQAYANRGNVYAAQGHFDQALSDYNKAIEIDPNYADAYVDRNNISPDSFYDRGLSFAKQGNFTQAMSDFNNAIKINPDYAKAYINRGNIYSQQGDFTQALADFNKAIKIDPNITEVYTNRGTLYAQQGSFAYALSDYDKAITIDPGFQGAYFNRAVIYYQLKEYAKAWADVNKAEELGAVVNPRFISALSRASGKFQ